MNHPYISLIEYMQQVKPVNTHGHHQPDAFFSGEMTLKKLLDSSYCAWCGIPLSESDESRSQYFSRIGQRSYFKSMEQALKQLYHLDIPLNKDTYAQFDDAITNAYRHNPQRHLQILREECRYRRIIQDCYWQPGSDNGHPDLFAPTFRIDSFFWGFDESLSDHNQVKCGQFISNRPDSLEDFIEQTHMAIKKQKEHGAVAMKCAVAYERGLDFEITGKEAASQVFAKTPSQRKALDIRAFQDYLMFALCEIAGNLNLPLQIHTGLGKLHNSNAAQLLPLISTFKNTKFVLFHGGYPWLDDILGLAHNFPNNVITDLVWLPIISRNAATRMINELLDVANTDTICWGCDTWVSEESYGALLSIEQILADVLSDRISRNLLTFKDACSIASNIMAENARAVYSI
ncbi:MAG: amidohydrolase family protein [Bacillota bacterium]|nr:amidohydrolase family protein [Bacillota bacterium]